MKKIILKYILMYSAFILGIGLYSFKIYNIFSSLLLFVGGYVAIKNTIDYRKVNKNIDYVKNDNNIEKDVYESKTINSDIKLKKIKTPSRVRKRIKE